MVALLNRTIFFLTVLFLPSSSSLSSSRVGTVGSHLHHFTISSMVADFQFASPVEDVLDRLFSAIQLNKVIIFLYLLFLLLY